jgi:hypothetical protein
MCARFVVAARSDGRGGFRPFGTFTGRQKGTEVQIGNRNYKVAVDGRVNIPKKVMNQLGVMGDDGRMRVTIEFASAPSSMDIDAIGAVVSSVPTEMRNAMTGDILPKTMLPDSVLEPADAGDYNWSP